jgi:hypothetical protein
MEENQPFLCSNCNQPMKPVELDHVPAEDIKDFLDIDGNKLMINWYWCSKCDSYDQCSLPETRLSPEAEQQMQVINDFLSSWWL